MNLSELYQEVILDHNKNPRNYKDDTTASNYAEGFNPLCGDQLKLYLNIEDEKVTSVSFTGCGCAISIASASLLTESIVGKTCVEAEEMFQQMHNMLKGKETSQDLGKLTVLAGVKEFPARVKCASLAWHTLSAALLKSSEMVKTE